MLDVDSLDLEEIANALADQVSYDSRWLLDPDTGQLVYWTVDRGIDGTTPVDLDDLDRLLLVEPLPSYVWYQDMEDFAQRVTEEHAGRELTRAIQGRGAFRRFPDVIHQDYPHLISAWYAFRDMRAKRRAVEWLVDNSLIDDEAASTYLANHPDHELP